MKVLAGGGGESYLIVLFCSDKNIFFKVFMFWSPVFVVNL